MTKVRLKPIAEQVVVVTGASSGIGLVTARRLAAAGASVMLIARNDAALAEAVRDIESEGGAARYAVADVGDLEQVRNAAAKAVEAFGRINAWVNDAGVAIYTALVDAPIVEHEALFRTNYFGAVNGAQVAVEHMRESGGALITVGSIAGDMPSPVMGAYAASKHAVKGYIESLRLELNAAGVPISVTLIKPSGIDTPIADHAAKHIDGEAMIPSPVYDPELVAAAILDALRHPRRNVTVGGIGRAQVLAATHAPRIFAALGGLTAPMMIRPGSPARGGGNLEAPAGDGHGHSTRQHGRRFSIYAARPRSAAAIIGLTLAAGLSAAWVATRSNEDQRLPLRRRK